MRSGPCSAKSYSAASSARKPSFVRFTLQHSLLHMLASPWKSHKDRQPDRNREGERQTDGRGEKERYTDRDRCRHRREIEEECETRREGTHLVAQPAAHAGLALDQHLGELVDEGTQRGERVFLHGL